MIREGEREETVDFAGERMKNISEGVKERRNKKSLKTGCLPLKQ